MSIDTKVTVHNQPRTVHLRLDLNKTLTIEVNGKDVTPLEVLQAAAEQLGETLHSPELIAVGANGGRRVESLEEPLRADEETLVVDRKRSNG